MKRPAILQPTSKKMVPAFVRAFGPSQRAGHAPPAIGTGVSVVGVWGWGAQGGGIPGLSCGNGVLLWVHHRLEGGRRLSVAGFGSATAVDEQLTAVSR